VEAEPAAAALAAWHLGRFAALAPAWASLALAVFAPDQAAALTRVGWARAARTLPTLLPDRQPQLQPDPDASGGAWATFAQARSTIGR